MPGLTEFACELKQELTKFVSIAQLGHLVTAGVHYGSDHVFQEDSFWLRCSGRVEIPARDPRVKLTYDTGTVVWPAAATPIFNVLKALTRHHSNGPDRGP